MTDQEFKARLLAQDKEFQRLAKIEKQRDLAFAELKVKIARQNMDIARGDFSSARQEAESARRQLQRIERTEQ